MSDHGVCSVCGAPLYYDNSPGRADSYASYTCSHGPSSDFDYDRGTGHMGAAVISRDEWQEKTWKNEKVWDDR